MRYCTTKGIQYEAWSPLMQGKFSELTELEPLAQKYKKSVAQIILRWDLQKEVVTIPKSSNKERIKNNAQIFDFDLSLEEMTLIDSLDKGQRFGPNPDNFDF
jgi:diketogulonate reductase-like aldo/keto reductase